MSERETSILFLDMGISGHGGSFVSLLQIVRLLNEKKNYDLHVALCNFSHFSDEYKKLGVSLYQINNFIYSKKFKLSRFFYNKLVSLLSRILPSLIIWVDFFFQINFYLYLGKKIRKYNIKILHLNNQPIRNFVGFWLAKKYNLKVISHVRTLNTYSLSKHHINFIRNLNPIMIAVSKAVKSHWINKGIPSEWFDVLYNPYDSFVEPLFFNSTRNFKLIYIGRLEKQKGIDFLLDVFSAAYNKLPCLKLTIIGQGSAENSLKRRIIHLGLEEKIEFKGYIPNAKSQLKEYDLLFLPSVNEGFGRVLLEAMAAGTLVVATKVGGVSEIIQDQYTGFLVDYGNVAQASDRIVDIFKNDINYKQVIKNAYFFVKESLSEENFCQSLTRYYEIAG